jgi:hypothetical protein
VIGALALLILLATDATPQPAPSDFPEIGRVRSISPACAAMRDLAIPAFTAARAADRHFAGASNTLIRYVGGKADESDAVPESHATRAYLLNKLGQDKTKMLQDAKVIADALGDPRIAANIPDPTLKAERAQLESLYESQINRASLLNQFVMREENASVMGGVGRGRSNEPPPGMPTIRGIIVMSDVASIQDWTGQLTAGVRANENVVAKALYPVASGCAAK